MQPKVAIPTAVLIIMVVAAGAAYARSDAPAPGLYQSSGPVTPIALEWLVPHTPYEVFTKAAALFDQELREKSQGSLSLKRTVDLDGAGLDLNAHSGMLYLDRGGPKIIAEYVDHLSQFDSRLQGLKLPFLFDDYDEALAFLDGPKAQALLDGVSASTAYHALAFTMSGGLRILVSKDKKIERPEDLKGMRVLALSNSDVTKEIYAALGATAVPDASLETTPDVEALKGADAAELTYTRVGALLDAAPWFARYVAETYHNISLTVLMVSDEFYDSLSAADQQALSAAAHDAAVQEKQESIAIAGLMRQKLAENGSVITALTREERDAFKAATATVRRELDSQYPLVIDAVTR